MNKIHDDKQILGMCGVGAHHHNGTAENAIKNISRKARIYLLHIALRWPEGFDKTMWLFSMMYTVYMQNHMPQTNDCLSPAKLWTKAKANPSHLLHAHPLGVPAHVLNTQLQDGHKIPRFDRRTQQGVFWAFINAC